VSRGEGRGSRAGGRAGVTGPGDRPRRWRLVRARGEAVPASLRRFTFLAGHYRMLRWLVPLVALGVVVVLVGSLVVVYRTSLFAVTTVRVEGAGGQLPAADVRKRAGVADGSALASVDLDAVRSRVAGLPAVRSVTVDTDWPHAVVIRVSARTPVAALPADPAGSGKAGYRLIDASGVVFGSVPAVPAGLPALVVSHPGPRDESTRAALQVLASLTPQLRQRLVRLEASRPTRVRLALTGGRTIVWGDAADNARKAQVATVLLARSGSVIDVSAPDLVTVR
jgi:cell division protein FtsQ